MNYQETVEYLYSQMPMFSRTGGDAYKEGLGTSVALDMLYNNPHKAYKTIHVAGTNGKGSTSHLIASILQQSGYKVGLYTSPHLVDFRERIRVNGEMIPEQDVVDFVESYRFVRDTVQKILGENVKVLDGGAGTARQTKRLLEERGWLRKGEGSLKMENSSGRQELLDLGMELLKK